MKTCGLDVHKDSVFCAIYNGKKYSTVTDHDTTMPKIRQMGEYLRAEGISKVAMESTSTYWVPIWDILVEMGFELMLLNPFLIKQMPGRKSDIKDAQLIAIARKLLTVTWNVLYYKTPYNPQLVPIYDPIKVEVKINYHQREMERMQKLLK
jgi:transposase